MINTHGSTLCADVDYRFPATDSSVTAHISSKVVVSPASHCYGHGHFVLVSADTVYGPTRAANDGRLEVCPVAYRGKEVFASQSLDAQQLRDPHRGFLVHPLGPDFGLLQCIQCS
jgi:hypothetical protein